MRVFEGNALFFGKGLWLKVWCWYSQWLYIFSFTVTGVFDISLIHHPKSFSLPKFEFNLSVFGRDLIATAKQEHQAISDKVDEWTKEREQKAAAAIEELKRADLLDKAEDYSHGWYLVGKDKQ
jgi:hypothetical protein